MTVIVLLDAGPLGSVSKPRMSDSAEDCRRWLESLIRQRVTVLVPEIADDEVRRELLRHAARLWAEARQRGRPTAVDVALDADVILAGQALALAEAHTDQVVIATTNLRHLEQFITARLWQEIAP
ncbi:MAG: hypothetical protein IT306_24215 [Chloroflexi bacterium]|nr:hypothetical protein [Chloroflexota bacterium]